MNCELFLDGIVRMHMAQAGADQEIVVHLPWKMFDALSFHLMRNLSAAAIAGPYRGADEIQYSGVIIRTTDRPKLPIGNLL